MKRAIITGASGFVGAATVAPLRALGFELHCLGRHAPAGDGLIFHQLDLLREDAGALMKQIAPSHLLHLAWHDDRATIWHSMANLDWTAATRRLVLAFRNAGGTRAVLAGTAAEYDWTVPLLDDRQPRLEPATLYGRAKKTVYELSRAEAFAPLSIGHARIFFPFGPRDKPDRLLSQVIDGVAAGHLVSCSSGEQVRPFIHVDDVGSALAQLLDSDVEGAVNIALDEVCSVRELALLAAECAGDAELVRFGTRDLQPWEPPCLRATTDRLYGEVGFRPSFTIAEGVASTVRQRLNRVPA